jgi:hypothetical protein
MGRIEHGRLLDTRFLNLEQTEAESEPAGSALLPVLQDA